jgi:hypothetical protein
MACQGSRHVRHGTRRGKRLRRVAVVADADGDEIQAPLYSTLGRQGGRCRFFSRGRLLRGFGARDRDNRHRQNSCETAPILHPGSST